MWLCKQLFYILICCMMVVMTSCRKDEGFPDPADNPLLTYFDVFVENGGRVDWSPTAKQLVLDKKNGDHYDVYLTDASGHSFNNLTGDMTGQTIDGQHIEDDDHRGQPAWHPSGKYIVFQVTNEHANNPVKQEEKLSLGVNNDLWFMHADGSNKQKLTESPEGRAVLHAHFSHDGNKLLWAERYEDNNSASKFGAWRLIIADVQIDNQSRISLSNRTQLEPKDQNWYESHSFSTDDQYVYFSGNLTTHKKANDIYRVNLKGGQLKNITDKPKVWDEMYNINPVTGQVSFISSRFFDWSPFWGWSSLRTEIYLMDQQGDNVQRLTWLNDPNHDGKRDKKRWLIGDHCWGPDGQVIFALAYEAKSKKSTIFKITLD